LSAFLGVTPEHSLIPQALALDAARQSLVLLRNRNNILPLNRKSVGTIAVIGALIIVHYTRSLC
jgi:beta-glucosidase-like glycosyl hydrolase